MRLIDADALQRALAERWYEAPKRLSGIKVSMLIDEQPTIEPKTGRWIIDRKFGADIMSNEQMVICSKCKQGIFWGKQNYCPNCGAKMGAEE